MQKYYGRHSTASYVGTNSENRQASTTRLFFELTRLSCTTEAGRLSRTPATDEWEHIRREVFRQALAGVLFAAVERLPAEQRPPREVLLPWYMMKERIAAANRRLNRRAAEASEHFAAQGFRSLLLKGQGVAMLYPDPMLRQPGDIDIWLEGNRQEILACGRKRFPEVPVRYHHMDYPIFGDTAVELHFTPSWMNSPSTHRRLQRYFAREAGNQFGHLISLPEDAGQVAVPTLAFNRVYLLVHIYRHLFGEGIGLRQLQDYYFVLMQGTDKAGRKDTADMLRRLRMTRFARATMYVLQAVFGLSDNKLLCTPDERCGRFLLSEVMQAGNFGHHDARLKRHAGETAFYRFRRSLCRNARFVRDYPSEVLCDPIFKIGLYAWRLWNGYMGKKKS